VRTSVRTAIYTRISLDRRGESESPPRQEADCRAVAKLRGWEVAEVYSDRDTSAFNTKVRRPQYERLLRDLADRKVGAVIVWKLDRLVRRFTAVGEVLKVLEETGAELASVQEPWLDTTSPMGKGVLGMVAGMAEQESQNTSDRVKSAHRSAVKGGKMHAGGNRRYGYKNGQIVPEEAEVIRDCTRRVLGGESLRSLARDLNERGVKTSAATGKPRKRRGSDEMYVVKGEWRSITLSQVLRSPTLAGLRVHNGDTSSGNWDPIISEAEHAELLRVLASRRSDETAEDRSHLLSGSGVIRCGLCKQPMRRMSFRMHNGRKFSRYQCLDQPGQTQCGRVSIAQDSTDKFVTDELLYFLTVAEVRPLEGDESEDELESQLAEARASLGDLDTRRYVQRRMEAARYERLSGPLEVEIASLEARLRSLQRAREERATQIPLGDHEALDRWWAGASPAEKIAVVRQAIRTVTIHPARRRGGNKFDDKRVDIEWRYDIFRI
jgi:DNA invertase Pin-like site-specific DNA recombinase